ncbi:DUF6069 family protein [Yinghuangia seranimata]|uniref:DUF6069 family protein n=1 Tax=Yinghuangia seranimata TaxID=408067 RepID=UPI00248B1D18|nr:DUF6069 family protein [Yinghuangia seranimata]MDI2132950.1 DUF6069 family protein [Yinghuangia seranimata]
MTTTTISTAISTANTASTDRSTHAPLRPVAKATALASVGGAVVAGVYEAAIRGIGVSTQMGTSKADAEPIPAGGFVGFTLMFAVAGLLFALAVARWAKRPARTYAVTAWSVVAASLVLPFLPAYMAGETRVALAAAHLVVAAAVVPVVTRSLRTHRA